MQKGGLFCEPLPEPRAVLQPLFNLSLHIIPTWHVIGLIKYIVCWLKLSHSFSFAGQYLGGFDAALGSLTLSWSCWLSLISTSTLSATQGHTPASSCPSPGLSLYSLSLALVPAPQHTHTCSSAMEFYAVNFLNASESLSLPTPSREGLTSIPAVALTS